jgi:hypothetical protein
MLQGPKITQASKKKLRAKDHALRKGQRRAIRAEKAKGKPPDTKETSSPSSLSDLNDKLLAALKVWQRAIVVITKKISVGA